MLFETGSREVKVVVRNVWFRMVYDDGDDDDGGDG